MLEVLGDETLSAVQIMSEIGVPTEYQEEVKKYKNFWSSGNLGKFNALKVQNFSNDSIDLGIMCVLANGHIPNKEVEVTDKL